MKWNDHVFNRISWPGSSLQLAVFRIAIGLQILYAVNSKVFPMLLKVGKQQNVYTIFPNWFDQFIANHLVEMLVVSCTLLSLLLIIGLLTRFVLPLLLISFLLLFSFYYLGANAPVNWLYFWFPLLTLCFSNSQHSLSLDSLIFKYERTNSQQYRWPIEMASVWFVYIYFSAGLAKVFPVTKGVDWIYGITSKEIIYYRFLDSPLFYIFQKPFFNYAEETWVFTGLSLSALVLELSTILILFTRRFTMPIFSLLLTMHLFLYLTGVASFTQMALVLGISLLNPQLFNKYDRQAGIYSYS
jgi:hypothetical protein